ncbi:MAG: alpha/beta hydrolase [Myxococcota bacterium]
MIPALLLLGCQPQITAATAALRLTECHIQGLDAESRCGTLTVFEDRAAQQGRTLDLNVLVVPAVSPTPQPDPLFILAGGPGQAASEVAAQIFPAIEDIQARRDLVFLDQRGTGGSNPLQCPDTEDAHDLTAMLLRDMGEAMRACQDAVSENADLSLYSTPIAMDDLDDVRAALGYETINLYGVSYGTRAGLVYLRRHPDRVRAAILDGVAPLEMAIGLHFAEDGQAALDAMFSDCAADVGCDEKFPALKARYAALHQALSEPRAVDYVDPRTGASKSLEMDQTVFAAGVQGILYQPIFTSLLPLSIAAAEQGDFTPFIAQAYGMSDGVSSSIYSGMQMSVMCAEDQPRYPQDRSAVGKGTSLGSAIVEEISAACAEWPRATLPDGFAEPVTSTVPVLLLSGALDPVTPPRWGEIASKSLPNSLHIVAPGAGHNVAPVGCGPRLMEAFIDAGAVDDLDRECINRIKRPPFFLDFSGPTP